MHNIKIAILGQPGDGKTSIAKLIESALIKKGASVNLIDDFEEGDLETIEMRINSLVKCGLNVTIETVQCKEEKYNGENRCKS